MKAAAKVSKALSLLILLAVLLVYIPLTVPRLLGFDSYAVISGSMEPTIKVGSVAYAKPTVPEELQEGDIIIFFPDGAATPVTHRVVENVKASREIVTKGDANTDVDLRPVDYDNVQGKIEFSIPYLGFVSEVAGSGYGKIAAVIFLFCAVLLGMLSTRLSEAAEKQEKENAESGEKKKNGFSVFVYALFAVLVMACAFAGYRTFSSMNARIQAQNAYEEAAKQQAMVEVEITPEPDDGLSEFDKRPKTKAPNIKMEIPEIDFAALKQDGYDAIAWIYIPDTKISYPVFQSIDNDFYLHHSGQGYYSESGAIFLDCRNYEDFNDTHSILYGHHMADGSMFAGLRNYRTEGYYDSHRYGMLITPEGNHLIEFYAGYVANVKQKAWDVEFGGEEGYAAWIDEECSYSCFYSNLEPKTGDRTITLSTCSYEFDDAKFVMHGILY